MISRRQFGIGAGATALAFAGLSRNLFEHSFKPDPQSITPSCRGYGPLVADENELLDLPAGFSYQVISQLDDVMNDGLSVPDRADGMGCFALDNERVVLIRNHELKPKHLASCAQTWQEFHSSKAYDCFKNGVALPGGTTHLIYNVKTQILEQQFLSLVGTIRNCSGGTTPWNTWLSCEECTDKAGDVISRNHGYVFEVPADAKGLVEPIPLKAMGRFNHEAAAVDPKTGIVYLTEDRHDSLFYRFVPKHYGQLAQGGKLQALAIKNNKHFDSRNWNQANMKIGHWLEVEWVDIDNPDSAEDDLRLQGYAKGAALFARGEGINKGLSNQGLNNQALNNLVANGSESGAQMEFYFCCTNGGAQQAGQIMRYQPSAFEGQTKEAEQVGRIQLFLESSSKQLYDFGDNLTVANNGHLLVCEDQYTKETNNRIRGVTPSGKVYDVAHLRVNTESAGACFSPDGEVLFVNLYSPTRTLAISGPWHQVDEQSLDRQS